MGLDGLERRVYAEGGTRTHMPVQAQRPERCVSTNFTTSARCVYPCIVDVPYITLSFAACQEGMAHLCIFF
jgi:hypothetical protein